MILSVGTQSFNHLNPMDKVIYIHYFKLANVYMNALSFWIQ